VPLSADIRASLLDRFGLFGVRLSVVLLRTGVADAPALADELLRRSGLHELQELIAVHFTRRGAQLKAANALHRLEQLLRSAPRAGTGPLWAGLERLRLSATDLAELELLARLRAVGGPLPPALLPEAERLLGAAGTGPAERLGLPAGTSLEDLCAAAAEVVGRWRAEAAAPLLPRATADAMGVVVRSVEAVLAGLEGSGPDAGEPDAGSVPAGAHPATDGRGQQGE